MFYAKQQVNKPKPALGALRHLWLSDLYQPSQQSTTVGLGLFPEARHKSSACVSVQQYPARSKTWASATTFFVQMLVLYGSEIAWKVAQAALVRAADPTPAAQWGTGATGSPSDKSPTCRGLEQTPLHALCYTLPFDRASNKCSLQIHSCSWPPLEGVLLN